MAPKTCSLMRSGAPSAWRTGTKGPFKARFAAVRVRDADGPPQRIGTRVSNICRGTRSGSSANSAPSGEQKYYLANLPAEAGLKTSGRDHQGSMDLRAGAPATKRRTRPRPLRGPLMARPSSSRPDDHDRIRLPSASSPPSKNEKREKKMNGPPRAKLADRAPRYRRSHHATASALPNCRRWVRAGLRPKLNLQRASVPIPKFASSCGALVCELRNQNSCQLNPLSHLKCR